jgi:N-acetylglucosaminyldiphosphoundecaprenol N-acetyl-beta-D-mannosaminyltransferase
VRDPFSKILGVKFYNSDLESLLEILPGAGLIVAPSAPVMARLEGDPAHREALEGADIAVTDSSLMVVLWLLRTGERLRRLSGLRLLRVLLKGREFRNAGCMFWVMPSAGDAEANLAWLRGQGVNAEDANSYVAPQYPAYGPISDDRLLGLIRDRRPQWVFIALSGGVQERLGWDLRQRLGYTPSILCIGGAIAFLSGRQTRIPVWADRLALGWLLRFIAAPRAFAAKMRGVQRLAPLIWRYGSSRIPTAGGSGT